MELTAQQKKLILETIRRTPSAHNVQPLKVQFRDYTVKIYACSDRFLPVADRTHTELKLTIGALIYGLELALNHLGFLVTNEAVEMDIFNQTGYTDEVKEKDIHIGTVEFTKKNSAVVLKSQSDKLLGDPESTKELLFQNIEKRFSYRGIFQKPGIEQIDKIRHITETMKVITDPPAIRELAKLFDRSNLELMATPGFLKELFSWTRYFKGNPNWARDGVNSEALSLNFVETVGASLILRPFLFRILHFFGITGLIIKDAPKILSSSSVAVIFCPKNTSRIDHGKIFYRDWLLLTIYGFYGAPLSALATDPKGIQLIKDLIGISHEFEIVNVLKFGILPSNYNRYPLIRLPIEELEII